MEASCLIKAHKTTFLKASAVAKTYLAVGYGCDRVLGPLAARMRSESKSPACILKGKEGAAGALGAWVVRTGFAVLVGGVFFYQSEDVIHGADFIVLVKEHRIPADFAILFGDSWGDALGGQLHADRVIVGDRGDKAQVL